MLPTTGETVRALFSREIAQAKLTKLFGIQESSPEWQRLVNELVDTNYRNDQTYVGALLNLASSKGRRIVFVLDNSDRALSRIFM